MSPFQELHYAVEFPVKLKHATAEVRLVLDGDPAFHLFFMR